jgi:hypothetical protein
MRALELRAAPAVQTCGGRSLVPPWVAPAFLVCALVLLPWTALLFITLPAHYVANHWQVAWSGFDVGLGLALASTAMLIGRRSPFAEVAATVTATLLVCDAWFDVLTSRGTSDVAQALVEALFVELPLAALCFWMARNFADAMEVARPYLERAGFSISGNRLRPPAEPNEAGQTGAAS